MSRRTPYQISETVLSVFSAVLFLFIAANMWFHHIAGITPPVWFRVIDIGFWAVTVQLFCFRISLSRITVVWERFWGCLGGILPAIGFIAIAGYLGREHLFPFLISVTLAGATFLCGVRILFLGWSEEIHDWFHGTVDTRTAGD